MRSRLLEEADAERRDRLAALSPEERVALSLRLGRRARAIYAAAHGVSLAEAHAALVAARDRSRG